MSKSGSTHHQKELKMVSKQTKLEVANKSSMKANTDLINALP